MSDQFFEDKDLQIIQSFVDEKIVGSKSMTAVNLYSALKSKLSDEVTESRFKTWLGIAVKDGKIVGIKGKRRVGYVSVNRPDSSAPPAAVIADNSPAVADESENSPAENQPVVEHSFVSPVTADRTTHGDRARRNRSPFAHHIWVDRKCYRLVGSWGPLEAIVFQVLNGKQGPDGRVVFNGKRYECDAEMFERIIVHTLAVVYDGESEPVFDSETGISAELLINAK